MGGGDFQKRNGNLSDEIAEIRNERINTIKMEQEELDGWRDKVLVEEVDYWFKQIKSEILSKASSGESSLVFSVLYWSSYDNQGSDALHPLRKTIVQNITTKNVRANLTFFNHPSTAVMYTDKLEVLGEMLHAKEITAMQIHEKLMQRLKSEGLDVKSQWNSKLVKGDVRWLTRASRHYNLEIHIHF